MKTTLLLAMLFPAAALSAEVPEVFRKGTLYATAALAGSASYALLLWAGATRPIVFWVPILVVLVVRLGALRFGWGVPVIGEKSRNA